MNIKDIAIAVCAVTLGLMSGDLIFYLYLWAAYVLRRKRLEAKEHLAQTNVYVHRNEAERTLRKR